MLRIFLPFLSANTSIKVTVVLYVLLRSLVRGKEKKMLRVPLNVLWNNTTGLSNYHYHSEWMKIWKTVYHGNTVSQKMNAYRAVCFTMYMSTFILIGETLFQMICNWNISSGNLVSNRCALSRVQNSLIEMLLLFLNFSRHKNCKQFELFFELYYEL